MKKRAVTLVEVMIALCIFAGLSATVYYLMREASVKRARADARTKAQQETGRILSAMQQDFSQARMGTFDHFNVSAPKFGVSLPNEEATVTYLITPPKLVRKSTASRHQAEMILSDHLESLEIEKQAIASGQILVKVKLNVPVSGLPVSQAHHHEQNQLITMRADASKSFDKNWVDSGDFTVAAANTTAVAAGAGGDVNAGPSEGIQGAGGAIADMSAEKLEEKFVEIAGKIRELAQKLDDLDQSLADIPNSRLARGSYPENHFKGGYLKSAFTSVKTASQWKDLSYYQSLGISTCRVSDSFTSFYEGKKNIFDNGKNLVNLLKSPPFNKSNAAIAAIAGSANLSRF